MAVGKISEELWARVVERRVGATRPDVRVGPRAGVDAAIVELGEGRFLAVAEDPIFVVPGVSVEDFGWYTVHIGASDVAVMGIEPTHLTYSLLLPPDAPDDEVQGIVAAIDAAARELGIAIVGGHTGYAPVVSAPVVGGITVFGTGPRYVTAAGAHAGDELVMTKGPAVEAAGILARQYRPELLAAGLSPDLVDQAAALVRAMSVVADARIAFAAGEVHAMHDATEGGLVRGVHEMAAGAGLAVRLDREALVTPPAIAAVCRALELDPLHAISEGTLLVAMPPVATAAVLWALRAQDIPAWAIGRFEPGAGVRFDDGPPVVPAQEDPFWRAFFAKLGGAR